MKFIVRIIEDFLERVPILGNKLLKFLDSIISNEWGSAILRGIFYYNTKLVLGVIILLSLLLAPFIFAKWKIRDIKSYALLEVFGSLAAIILILPWNGGILNAESYVSFFDVRKLLVLLGAIYFGVRGVENWNKRSTKN